MERAFRSAAADSGRCADRAGRGHGAAGRRHEFTFNGTAGQLVEIFVDADNTTTGTPNPDLTFALFDPNGDADPVRGLRPRIPESLILELPLTGTYTVIVDSFTPAQFGDFLFRVQEVEVVEQVLSDYNLLFFSTDGTFIGALAEQNLFTNRPLEIGGFRAATLQMVIARANTPNGKNRNVADRIRYVGFSGVNPQEYFSYLDPVTYGHNSAAGANGVAAYAFFAPFVPEAFTSPGPSTIYFDKNNKRFKHPEIRQKPDMAAMDGANTTFFVSDSSVDPDTFPNFFGTSAAAPHAAAIAALVLDAAGGPGTVKPKQDAQDPAGQRVPSRPRSFLLAGLRAVRAGTLLAINARPIRMRSASSTRTCSRLTQFGLRQPARLLHQRQRRQSDADAEGDRVRRADDAGAAAGPAVRGRSHQSVSVLPT